MKILVIGASGLLGGDAAVHFAGLGHAVTVAARKPPPPTSPMANMPFLAMDYVTDVFDKTAIGQFDAIVFAAVNDPRMISPSEDVAAHWQRVNSEAVPKFLANAKAAGVRRVALLGSFYHRVLPDLIGKIPYIRSRHEAEIGALALAGSNFHIVSLNPPFVVGHLPGVVAPHLASYAAWGKGLYPHMPNFVPAGGVNVMSTRSLSEAIAAALFHGENGRSYLVGDQNMSFAEYFGLYFKAGAGLQAPLEVRDSEHPLISGEYLIAGPGAPLYYEIDTATARLNYRRNDVERAIAEVVANYKAA